MVSWNPIFTATMYQTLYTPSNYNIVKCSKQIGTIWIYSAKFLIRILNVFNNTFFSSWFCVMLGSDKRNITKCSFCFSKTIKILVSLFLSLGTMSLSYRLCFVLAILEIWHLGYGHFLLRPQSVYLVA